MNSELLFDEKLEVFEAYTLKINGGGYYNVKESGEVIIKFINGTFHNATAPFQDATRNGWRIFSAIEARITEIELAHQSVKPTST